MWTCRYSAAPSGGITGDASSKRTVVTGNVAWVDACESDGRLTNLAVVGTYMVRLANKDLSAYWPLLTAHFAGWIQDVQMLLVLK